MLARTRRRWQVLVDTPMMRMVRLWICIMEKPYTRPQEYGSGVQEAARHDAGWLAGEERPPGRHAAGSWLRPTARTERHSKRFWVSSACRIVQARLAVLSACHTVTVSKIQTFP
jgi:hypothetical protein